jgi:hypothetical protein
MAHPTWRVLPLSFALDLVQKEEKTKVKKKRTNTHSDNMYKWKEVMVNPVMLIVVFSCRYRSKWLL